MARSSHIYLVRRYDKIVGAFTVKHEMVSWLERHNLFGRPAMRPSGMTVDRIVDGARQIPYDLTRLDKEAL